MTKTKTTENKKESSFSKQKMKNLLQSLEDGIRSFSFSQSASAWTNYYEEANQRGNYIDAKKQIITNWINKLKVNTIFDAGSNKGEFSRIAASLSSYVVSTDLDHSSINALYNEIREKNISNIFPLLLDLANPSPAIGVNNQERFSFLTRAKVDLVLALALLHHLAIGKNIPFTKIAEMFSSAGKYLIIEFIPPEDEKIKLMALHKKDVLASYSEENFISDFQKYFIPLEKQEIGNTGRTLYLMEKQNA